jgi:tetratricopeptide (TPR) repeat protein
VSGDRLAPGALSALLAEIARLPEVDAAAAAPRPGDRVGRFTLVRELGRGGFGQVFEAADPELRRRVALKLVRPARRGDAGSAGRAAHLQREAEAAAQLQHPNIVTVHDVGRGEAGPWLVMELLRGESVAERLQRGRLPVRQAVGVGVEVARALVHAHAAGVLHRDLKPGNVFLVEDGPAKVLDFGLAHAFGTLGPAGSGTPGYMAPEQRDGRPEDERTDVFALGLLLHEMVTGVRREAEAGPLGAGPLGPLAPPGVPSALEALVARAADPVPARRPASAAEVLAALLEVERGWEALAAGPPDRPAGGGAARHEALRQYFLGEQCARHPALGQDCGAVLRRAVGLDPTLAPAWYELAVWLRWFGGSRRDQEAAVAAALRHAAEASPREQALIEAFAAQVAGRDGEALDRYRRLVEAWPDEVRAWYQAGDLLRHRDEPEAALPWFEQVVALDPEFGWAAGHLADALGALGRRDALGAWVRRLERAPGPGALHGLSLAYGWLGDLDAARAAGERAVAVGGGVAGREDQLAALFFSGRFAEAEVAVRPLAAPQSPVRRMGYYGLAALQAYQGRRRAGLALLDELARELPAVRGDWNWHAVRADYLLGDGDLDGVRAGVAVLRELEPRAASEHAVSLAWLGAHDEAAALAAGLPPGSVVAATCGALAAWDAGRRGQALDALRAACRRAPVLTWRVAPLHLLGELCLREGLHEEAAAALTRVQGCYVWRQMWRSWAWPRGQLLLAQAHHALGERERAAAALERLLSAWAGAEPGAPLLDEALALRARLG